jgi:hypothetical protein
MKLYISNEKSEGMWLWLGSHPAAALKHGYGEKAKRKLFR